MRSSNRSSNVVDHESSGSGRRSDYHHYHHHSTGRTHSESNGHSLPNTAVNIRGAEYSRPSKRPSTGSSTGNIIKRMKNFSQENNTNNNDVDHHQKVSSKANKQATASTNHITKPVDPNECHKLTWQGISFEEEEALSNADNLVDAAKRDLDKFTEAASELRKLVKAVLELKKKKRQDRTNDDCEDDKTNDVNARLSEAKVKALMQLMEMKSLNRLDKYRLREARKKLAYSKEKVDQIHLQLQNIQYEVMHLQKERKTCDSFRSKDETLDLVEEEKFLLSDHFPDELRHLLVRSDDKKSIYFDRKRATNEELYRLHLIRLEWELAQRVSSNNQLKQAEESRFRLEVEISAKTRTLSQFDPVLRNVIEAAKPLASQLNVPLQIYNSHNQLTPFLPQPLYVLYIQLCAYKCAFGHNYEVTIQGSAEEAQEYEKKEKNVPNLEQWLKNKTDEEGDAPEDDLDEDNLEHHRSKSKKSSRYHSHKSPKKVNSEPNQTAIEMLVDAPRSSELETQTPTTTIGANAELLLKCGELIQCHPMKVNLMFRQRHYQMICTFKYFSKLELIGFVYKIENLSAAVQNIGTEFTVTDYESNIFSKLLSSNDTGYQCPNPVVEYLLRRYGIIEYGQLFPVTGYTYDWAQRMAGIEYLDAEERPTLAEGGTIRVRSSIAMDCMDKTVKLMMLRFQSRINLQEQLQELRDKKTIDGDRFLESSGNGNETTLPKSRTIMETFHRITGDQLIKEIDPKKKRDLVGFFDRSDESCNDLFDGENFIFRMTVKNDVPDPALKRERTFEFVVYIIVPQNYPWRWPFFILAPSAGGGEEFFLNQNWLRSLEQHINVGLPQKIVHQARNTDESIYSTTLLLRQIYDLQYGLDVITETHIGYIKRANDEIVEAYSGPRFVNSSLSTFIIQGRDHSLKFI